MANKNNDEILNELFFKKKSYSDREKEKMAQYSPVKKTDDIKSLFGGNSIDGFVVSDTDEVKKRIIGALGMAFGSNTVKSMANKAIKSFPIIVSDDIASETVVIVKTMMEEQYASYIDLLVSNQIINLGDYAADGTGGNIAIQALNQLDGTDFSRGRIARQAQTGNLTLNDIMKNNPGWEFLRVNEEGQYNTGNALLDTLMEGAIVVPSEYANATAGKLYEEMLNEATPIQPLYGYLGAKTESELNDTVVIDCVNNKMSAASKITAADCTVGRLFVDLVTNKIYRRKLDASWELASNPDPVATPKEHPNKRLIDALNDIDLANTVSRYREYGVKRVYDDDTNYHNEFEKLLTPSVMVNTNNLQNSLDQSAASILTKNDPTSRYIRDRFEKASYLLASRRITGAEYISYVSDRLGIPISNKIRVDLVTKYKATDLVFKGYGMTVKKHKNAPDEIVNNTAEVQELRDCVANNRKYVLNKVVPAITKITGKDIIAVSAGTIGGAGAGWGTAAAITAIASTQPILWPFIVGGAVSGGLGMAIYRALMKRKNKVAADTQIIGWERVERLIDEMDANYEDLKRHAVGEKKDYLETDNKLLMDFAKDMEQVLVRNNVTYKSGALAEEYEINDLRGYTIDITPEKLNEGLEFMKAIDEEIKADDELYADIIVMNEAAKYVINTKKPGDIIVKQQKYNAKDIAGIVPMYGTRDTVAYGSVEYDKRDIKDRKFNEPLILTIKFRERYSDGKYNDNELTAVIGILGVVTRVPSTEMAEILKANAEGKTLSDFFKGDDNNNSKNLIGNLLADFSKSKYAEKLPTSGKVWANLEKVSALAVANKLAGTNHGNISNAHLVFSQREIDQIKNELGIDYLKNAKLTAQLMKKYSAFMIAVCNDVMQYLYTFSDPDAISWDDAPYSAYMGKSNSDQLLSAFTQYNRMKL